MLNWKTIYKILGALLGIEATLMALCMCMALIYNEDDVMAFFISVFITAFAAFILRYIGRKSDNSMSRQDSYLVVTLSWIIFSIFGTLPFIISGFIPNFTDAYFETMSGFTTTGATIINNVEALPHGLLFWRSMTQWIGGLGIVFFTIAILPSFVGGSVKVFAAEATGPIHTKLHPRLTTSSKLIWTVYIVLTCACFGCFMLGGMGWFDGLNYAMSTAATGGFATHNSSTAFFNSPFLEYSNALFCFIFGINFTLLYYSVVKLKPMQLFKSQEFKFYFYIVAFFTAFITFELVSKNGYTLEHAFRSGVFEVASCISTTGLFNDDAATWPHTTWVVLSICMFIGACSGSTSGGFKCIRGVMLIKDIKNQFRQMLHPNAVIPMKIDKVNVPLQKQATLLAFLAIYLTICVVASTIFIIAGIDNTDAITITLSSMGNVGPAFGREIGPTMSWSELPAFVKWICSTLMLIGRLEIFSVLVILSPSFWKDN